MDGSGTKKDPYKVTNFKELRVIRQRLDAYYKLVDDINAINTTGQDFEPIGNFEDQFTGTLDGNNYEIRNLCIKQPEQSHVGLFGFISEEGRVRNLSLRNSNIEGDETVGGLVGYNGGKIESSHMQGVDICGRLRVGGLAGVNGGKMNLSFVQDSHISGNRDVGSLVGRNATKIDSSYAVGGVVSGEAYVGGLVGSNWRIVKHSYVVEGDVSGETSIGGLVGRNLGGEVELSYTVKVDVSGETSTGGLVGKNKGLLDSSYTVEADISGCEYIGDLVGLDACGDNIDSCSTSSYLNKPNIPRNPDLVLLRKNHRILYIVETNTLYINVNSKIYALKQVSPIRVQSLVDNEKVVEITSEFMASVVIAT